MPLFTFECPRCQSTLDEYRTIANRDRRPLCKTCRKRMPRIISRARIAVFNAYRAVGAERGRLIRNSSEHRAYLRAHGYEEVGDDRAYAPPPDDPDRDSEVRKDYERSLADLKHAPELT